MLTASRFSSMSDEAVRDYILSRITYTVDDLVKAGIDPTTPHLFRFRQGEMRYPQFQFTLDDRGRPTGIKLAIPLINAMHTQRHSVDLDEEEAHRTYLLRYWLIPAGLLSGLSAYEALDAGGYSIREIQGAIHSLWAG